MGWLASCLLVVMLLPLLGMLYMDVMQTKHEARQQIEKMEKLRREVQQQRHNEELKKKGDTGEP